MASLFALIIFPLFLRLSVFYDSSTARLNFALHLYGKIRIIGGYARFDKTKIILHLTNDKAVIISPSKLNFDGGLNVMKALELIEFKNLTVLSQKPENGLLGAIVAVGASTILPAIKQNKSFATVTNCVEFWNNNYNVNYLTIMVCFNLLSLIKIFIQQKVFGIKK